MATPARPMHVPAGLPIDQVTRPEHIATGQANVQNRNVRNSETQALEKRLGSDSQPLDRLDGTVRASGRRIFQHLEAPCVIDADGNLDQYIESLERSASTGGLPEATYSLRGLPSPTTDANVFDSATTNDMIAVAYGKAEDSAALMVVVDANSGSVISPITMLGTSPGDSGFHAVGAISGRYFIAVTTVLLTGDIKAYVFDTQNVATGWASLGTIETDLNIAYPSICSLSDRVVVAYAIGSGTNRLVVKALDQTGVIDSTTISTAGSDPTFVDVDGSSSDVVWVLHDLNTALRVIALTPTSLSTVVGTMGVVLSGLIDDDMQSLRICAGDTHNAQIWFMYKRTPSVAVSLALGVTIDAGVVARGHNGTGSIIGNFAVYPNVIINSRPMYRNGRYYVFVAAGAGDPEETGSNEQSSCILADWTLGPLTLTNLRPVANVEPGLASRLQIWSKITPLDTYRWFYARQFLKSGSEASETGAYGASLVVLDFAATDRWRTAFHHGVTVIGGGVTGVWDGADFTELGFLSRPRPPTVNVVSGPGLTGDYRYVAIFQDVDAAGNVVVSGVSDTTLVTLTDETTTIPPEVPAVTYRTRQIGTTSGSIQPRVRTAIYRTLAGGEPPYYLVGFVPQSINLQDDLADTDLAARPKLYAPNLPGAVGEALDRRAPPQLTHIVAYNGMLVGAKGSSLFWSGQEVYGESTWFSPVFELPVSDGGDITGLAVQDGALVVFKRDRIFLVAGQTPSDNGAQGGLGEPRLVSSDWGCISADSIVATQLGVFFLSARGIEIFSRSQTVEWIGEPVVDALSENPIVTSAVVDGRSSLVRITLAKSREANGDITYPNNEDPTDTNGGGVDVVFDLSTKSWVSVDDRRHGTALRGEAAQHATIVRFAGQSTAIYAWLGVYGVVHLERSRGDDKECRDDDEWVTSQYTTAPWRLGLQQDQRVFEVMPLFERATSAGITIERAENYSAFGVSGNLTDAVWTSEFLDARPTQTRLAFRTVETPGYAVQLRLRDTAPTDDAGTDSGRGITWIGISADIGPKQGTTRGTPSIADEMRR